jgi:cysteine-rich repeat protein
VIARSVILGLLGLTFSACGGDDDRKKPFVGSGGTGGSAGSVGGTGGAGGASGAGTGGASGATGGVGGASTPCGNGQLDANEECDGTNLNQKTCGDYGFPSGELVCLPSCKLDTSQCNGIEHCADNLDNDNDGATDCIDSDCNAKCASACDTPLPIPDPATVGGTTDGHADSTTASCNGGASGPDVAYAITVGKTGIFEAILGSPDPLSVSIRTSCNSASSELACVAGKRLSIPVTAGTQLFVVVDGTEAATSGTFGLSVQSRSVVCGDTHRDDPEVCDDGNTDAGDGCSPTCTLEATESEPNETTGQANPFQALFFGFISGASDVDVMQIDVPQPGSSIGMATLDLGDGSCDNDELDSLIELRAGDGSLISSDDDGGEGKCSNLSETGLAAGTYYAVVKAAPGANPASFAYKLFVDVQ